MKKFISIISVIIISNSVLSCREAEELSTFTDNDQHEFVNYRNQTDANEFSKEGDSTTVTNITNDVEEPKKDKIKW